MKMIRTILIFALMLCALLPAGAVAEAVSGACGAELTWTYEDGVLTISGTGEMDSWTSYSDWDEERGRWRDYGDGIRTVVIEPGVTSVGGYAFYNCRNLTEVTLPDSVTSIGWRAFENCSALTGITLPKGLTAIDYQAFQDCSSLRSVEIPQGVQTIGKLAFRRCTSLTSLSLPASLTQIADSSFDECEALKDIYYGGESQDSWNALSRDAGFVPTANVHLGSAVTLAGAELETSGVCGDGVTWALTDGVLTISGTGDMTDFGWYDEQPWHLLREDIREIAVESGVTSIGDNAFYGLENVESIAIAEGVTSVGQAAFNGCAGLTEIVLPDGLTTIRDAVFTGGLNLASIVIPGSVTHIGWNAFAGCDAVNLYYGGDVGAWTAMTAESAVPAAAILHLGDQPPMAADSLTASGTCGPALTWSLENRVLTISGTGAMDDYAWITNESPWYNYRENIDAIVIGEGVESIGELAFASCSRATAVAIPHGVTKIGKSAFHGCSGLTELNLPGSVSVIGRLAFYGCSGLTELVIPEGVTQIGDNAFDACSGLTAVAIPRSLSLAGVEIFLNCDAITDVWYGGTADEWAQFHTGATTLLAQFPEGASIHFQ